MEQKAQEYINKLYIDYGDLNEKAEEQIKQAFIDGMKEQLLIQRVSQRSELYFAFMEEYNALMGEGEHQILKEEVVVLLAKYCG